MATVQKPKKEFKIHKRGTDDLKKVMVYGNDGSGKSTFVEDYCNKNHLKAVVIDIDDTNYTDMDLVELDLSTDLKAFQEIKDFIDAIQDTDYDTIVLDGVTSLLEHLTSTGKGMSAYSDRAKRWNVILRKLQASNKNLIFIGQADMRVLYSEDAQSSKAVIRVNSMVNEKYHTYINKNGDYKYKIEKMRTKKRMEK